MVARGCGRGRGRRHDGGCDSKGRLGRRDKDPRYYVYVVETIKISAVTSLINLSGLRLLILHLHLFQLLPLSLRFYCANLLGRLRTFSLAINCSGIPIN